MFTPIVSRPACCLISFSIVLAHLHAQPAAPDLSRITDPAVWRVHNRAASVAPDRPEAVQLDARDNDGVAWLVGSDFTNGTIEVELRGTNRPGQSFVGIAFRGLDDSTYDAVYFRPFNFKNSDPMRRSRAVQYVSMPGFPWQRLREESPGRYESAVNPVPDPDGWFTARIVVANGNISVFVNDATEPSLVVDELSDRRNGMIGLWVGNGSSGSFAKLRLSPADATAAQVAAPSSFSP